MEKSNIGKNLRIPDMPSDDRLTSEDLLRISKEISNDFGHPSYGFSPLAQLAEANRFMFLDYQKQMEEALINSMMLPSKYFERSYGIARAHDTCRSITEVNPKGQEDLPWT